MIGMVTDTKPENCELHGEYESQCIFGRLWTTCPVCADEKAKQEDAEREKQQIAERKSAEIENRLKRACIPPRFSDRSFDNFKADTPDKSKALEMCRSYAARFDRIAKVGTSLVFCGMPGTGKTHLAASIANDVILGGHTVLFATVSRAMRHIKSSWDRGSKITECEAIATFTRPELMIFDEVGVQFGSETEQNLLFGIINDRYENRKPTIIISNLDVDGIRGFLGDRAFDRLREDGGKLVAFNWESFRIKQRNEFIPVPRTRSAAEIP